jgi:hypothetical protein
VGTSEDGESADFSGFRVDIACVGTVGVLDFHEQFQFVQESVRIHPGGYDFVPFTQMGQGGTIICRGFLGVVEHAIGSHHVYKAVFDFVGPGVVMEAVEFKHG